MFDFLYEYGWIIATFIGLCGYFYWVYKNKGEEAFWTELREKTYMFMLLAEKQFGRNNGTGEFKFDFVVERVYQLLPNTMKVIFTMDDVKQFVQDQYDLAKDYLKDGKIDGNK